MRLALSIFAVVIVFIVVKAAPTPKGVPFRCNTTQVIEPKYNKPTSIFFSVTNLGKKTYGLIGSDAPFRTIPPDSITDLNENWSANTDRLPDMHFTSDGDGCQWTDFIIFANSSYTKGYVRVKDTGCGAANAYSLVFCTHA